MWNKNRTITHKKYLNKVHIFDYMGTILGRTKENSNHRDIIIKYDVKTWAEFSQETLYRKVLSSPYLLPQDFEIEVAQEITAQNFNNFGCSIADWLRPTPFSLNNTYEPEISLSTLRTQINEGLYRRISGYFGQQIGIGIYERKCDKSLNLQMIDEVLYLFSLNKKRSINLDKQLIWEGHLVIDINEICSPKPHDMHVTYQDNIAFIKANRRELQQFRLDSSGRNAEIKHY